MNSKENSEKKEKSASRNVSISAEVHKEIDILNGQIDAYSECELIEQLKTRHLKTDGNLDKRRKRLKVHYKNIHQATSNILSLRKLSRYYVVVDFEATCEVYKNDSFVHEIIEFPAVLINTVKQSIVDRFQFYVKPVVNPNLSDFCVNLTGITQEQVDNAEEFPKVLEQFEAWLKKHKLGTKRTYAIVTDSPWDMSVCLNKQCKLSGIPFPQFGKKWVNVKKVFLASYKSHPRNIEVMLHYFGMEFEGRRHCGLDDATNIGRLLLRMIEDGKYATPNEFYPN